MECLEPPMHHNDLPKVMMLDIEQVQLFFLAHPEGDHKMTDVQFIYQGVTNYKHVACSMERRLAFGMPRKPHSA